MTKISFQDQELGTFPPGRPLKTSRDQTLVTIRGRTLVTFPINPQTKEIFLVSKMNDPWFRGIQWTLKLFLFTPYLNQHQGLRLVAIWTPDIFLNPNLKIEESSSKLIGQMFERQKEIGPFLLNPAPMMKVWFLPKPFSEELSLTSPTTIPANRSSWTFRTWRSVSTFQESWVVTSGCSSTKTKTRRKFKNSLKGSISIWRFPMRRLRQSILMISRRN